VQIVLDRTATIGPAVAESKPSGDAPPRVARRRFRRVTGLARRFWHFISTQSFSSLTRRIVLLNLAGLLALVLSILYLSQFRAGLIEARVQSLLVQGEIIAGAIAASATVETDTITIDPDKLLELQTGESYGPPDESLSGLDFPINPERVAPLLLLAGVSGVLVVPTLEKNSIVVHNPVAPFFNRVFPNPYVHVSFEQELRKQLRTTQYPIQSPWEIPWELAVGGEKLQGLLGPVFLLVPLSLLALRHPAGRQLLLAALVFAVPYPLNIGTRFFLPCAAFLAPALILGVSAWSVVPVFLVLLHAYLSWPSHVTSYCDTYAYRLESAPVRAAARLESEDEYLSHRLGGYLLARRIEIETPPGSRIFSFEGPPQAYCAREILVYFESALSERLRDTIYAGVNPDLQPIRVLTFNIQANRLRRIRLVQTGSDRLGMPGISEIEILGPEGWVRNKGSWRVNAGPFPWDAKLAFDGNPTTQWRAWQATGSGAFVDVDFGQEEVISTVRLHVTPDQRHMRWRLEGKLSPGGWSPLSAAADISSVAQPMELRKFAVDELKQNGIGYLLVPDSNYTATDFRDNMSRWGIHLRAKVKDTSLYEIE